MIIIRDKDGKAIDGYATIMYRMFPIVLSSEDNSIMVTLNRDNCQYFASIEDAIQYIDDTLNDN